MKKKDKIVLTPAEMKLVKSSLRSQPQHRIQDNAFNGDHVKFGYYSDPHVGQKHFIEPLWVQMLKTFKREGIREIYCPGDKQNLSPNFAICWKPLRELHT